MRGGQAHGRLVLLLRFQSRSRGWGRVSVAHPLDARHVGDIGIDRQNQLAGN